MRGLKTKLSMWRNNLALLQHNLVAVTESFLDTSVEDSELVCGDWSIVRRDRGTPCGGVLLAARTPITLRRRLDLETDVGEDLWASFTWCGRPFHVCVVYLKPSSSDNDFMRWFCKTESFINDIKGYVIMLGDINLNSASVNIKNYYHYFLSFSNVLESNFVTNCHGGILDIVLAKESEGLRDVLVSSTEGIVPIDAYHPALDVEILVDVARSSDSIEPSNLNPTRDWNFRRCDPELLHICISNAFWDPVLLSDDVNLATEAFYAVIYEIFDNCLPKKSRKKTGTRRYPVWFTPEIISDTKRKVKLHASWKKTKSDETYKLFSDLRASLKARASKAYNLYLRNIEDNIALNPREFWRHISSLRSKGGFEANVTFKGEACSGVATAEAFASFFGSTFLSDIPALDAENVNRCDKSCNSNYVNVFEFRSIDVLYGIKKLKPKSSIGPDGVPPALLKSDSKSLVAPLSHIFNLALRTGRYPAQWKVSRVTPIPKTSNKLVVEEYRPIAILSSPAKVFESVLHKVIYAQIKTFLCNAQHGFRDKRSVNSNLLTLVEYISTKIDLGCQVDVLYFDFQKAFDRVNNDILLAKLSAIGFAPNLLRLLADYLRDRQQYVRHGIYESAPYHTRSGVSQGSILGPLLFILMINDLPEVVEHAECLLYADDLKLYTTVHNVADCEMLQRDINAVSQWSLDNKMEFNPAKCSVMSFGRKKSPVYFDYTIHGSMINRVTVIKDLGVTFDRKLTFHDHISTVAKQSFQRLGFVLRNARDFRSDNVVQLLFGALVRSKLESSCCVWNPHECTYSLLLEKVQKAFLRFLYKRVFGYYPFMYPTKFLQGCLEYNSLQTRRACDQIATMCKVLRGTIDAPDLHNLLFRLYLPDNYLRNRNHRLFSVPFSRTVARAHSPLPRTLAALNKLLGQNPDCDIFADEWKKILLECLRFCEIDE